MLTRINLLNRPAPAMFSHSTVVPAGTALLMTSGQVGISPDGAVPESVERQLEIVFGNILFLLKSAGTTTAEIVKVTTYLTSEAQLNVYREVRNKYIPDLKASATLVIVPGLADPRFKVEVEVIAAIPSAD